MSIDIIPLSSARDSDKHSHDVVTILEDGEINCISADLTTARWTADLPTLASSRKVVQDSEGLFIEYASLTNGSAVRRGLLKGREDVVATLDPSTEKKSDLLEVTPILCIIAQPRQPKLVAKDARDLHIFSLLPRSSNTITHHRPHVQHLLTWALPQPTRDITQSHLKSLYSLHAISGTLHQLLGGAIISYDLSGTVPRISSELKPSKDHLQSFVRISPTLIFGISAASCGLFDTKYNSIQSMVPLMSDTSTLPESKKRKYSHSAEKSESSFKHLDMLTFFSDIGLAVGLSNHELVGIQIGVNTRLRKSGNARETLLIDSIGKGIRSKRVNPEQKGDGSLPMPISRSIINPIYKVDQKWLEQTVHLDEYVKNNEVLNFEKLFAVEIGVSLDAKDIKEHKHPRKTPSMASHKFVNGSEGENITNGFGKEEVKTTLENGDGEIAEESSDEIPLPEWQLPKVVPNSIHLSHRHKALYALSKIFTWTESANRTRTIDSVGVEKSSIAIIFFPPNVFQWLLLTGYVTNALIERALRDKSSHNVNQTMSVSNGDIVTAIVNFDPEMRILHAVLNQSSFFPVSEIAQAIKLLIRSLDSSLQPKATMLLTNTPPTDDENVEHIESEIEAASQDLDLALSTLHDGLIIRSQTLRPALTRLHSFPTPLIISTLRTSLNHHEIIFLIHLLRLELKDGGWASRYFFDSDRLTPDASAGDPSDRAIAIIASLLSCALDAVGTVGWLTAANSMASVDSTEDVLHSLLLETSAALEGIWEAGFMKGLLSDFLRYSRKSTEGKQKPDNRKLRAQGKPELVHSWQTKDVAQTVEQSMLPLGVSELMGIEHKKVGIGGEVKKRSAREMGMMISKRVPKYSLERIVI